MKRKIKYYISMIFFVYAFCLLCSSFPAHAQEGEDPSPEWWLKPNRMLQTNLREIDATMDINQYIWELKEWGVNVVKFNVGGIVANYPTDVKYHWRNTYMKGDLTDTVLKRLHAEGIRMVGRFDVSKINEKFATEHPEWLYVSEAGENVNYNGQVHTCLSGGYHQEYMYEFLGEALDRYPLDGIFFNMASVNAKTAGDCSSSIVAWICRRHKTTTALSTINTLNSSVK